MENQQDLVNAATALSTTSDALSVKVDVLVSKVETALQALKDAQNLPPAAVAALAALKSSKDQAAAAGDKVDAEVSNLDTVLPTPAPAGV